MKWLATATGAFGVMVYALIAHQYHPHECSQRVWRRHVRGQAMTDRLRESSIVSSSRP
jgi:hypothetical protein